MKNGDFPWQTVSSPECKWAMASRQLPFGVPRRAALV